MPNDALIESARALLEHLEHDRFEDAQALAAELDYEISQLHTPPAIPMTPAERRWIAETLSRADAEAARSHRR